MVLLHFISISGSSQKLTCTLQVRLCRFGVVNLRAIYHTIASNYSEIGLSHTLQRSELKRPRDTGGRLFLDASQSRFNWTQPSDIRI